MWHFLKSHIIGVLLRQLGGFLYFTASDFKPCTLGLLQFYGPPEFIENCLQAINEVLPKYDRSLQTLLISGSIKLVFFYNKKQDQSWPTASIYAIPEHVWRYGAEGICQYIVFSHIRSICTGRGFRAALRLYYHRNTIFIIPKQKMITWLKEVKYPQKWINCYE